MAALQLRVGASLDRSVATVFSQMKELGRQANRAIAEEARTAAKGEEKAWREAEKELARMQADKRREAANTAKAQERSAREAARAEEQAAKEKIRAMKAVDAEMTRFHAQQMRERAAEAKRAAREEERAANDAAKAWVRKRETQQREMKQLAQGAMMYGANAALGAGRFGLSVLGDIAQGAGARLDMASHFAAASQMQGMATQLSNAGYMPSAGGVNAVRQDPAELMEQAYAVGNRTGTSANEVMGGMQQFVGKTGDLQSARDTIESLAQLSKATGSNLADMADAAADVSNQLGDVPDKGARIRDVMMAIAGQGKLGAVEIKDLASQMAKVAASAQLMEGDAGENIKLLGAVAQEARAHGGAASPQQAATSVSALMNTFSKSARIGEFKNLGISTTGAGGKMRNVEDIIVESLQKTQHGADATKSNLALGKLFMDVRARTAVRGFESQFRTTYAGTQGSEQEKLAAATKAVREEFSRLERVAMSENELRESFAAAMDTNQSQAEEWNNTMQKIASDTQQKLMPALLALAPVVADATTAFAGFITEVFGVKKPPADALDKESNKAHAASRTVAAMLEHPDKMSKEDFDMAEKLLAKRREKLRLQKQNAQVDLASEKAGGAGQVASDIVTEWAGGAISNIQKGGWKSVQGVFEAVPLFGIAKAAINEVAGTTETQKARAGNIQYGEQAVTQATAEEREVDEQAQRLQELREMWKPAVRADSIAVTIVADKSKTAGPPKTGGPGSMGLEPTE